MCPDGACRTSPFALPGVASRLEDMCETVTQSPSVPSPSPSLPPAKCSAPSSEPWKVSLVEREPSDRKLAMCNRRLGAQLIDSSKSLLCAWHRPGPRDG